jgi:hypothetical protein
MDRIVEDIIEYEHTDSELAKYTIVSLHNRINNLEKENQKLREALQTDKLMKAFMAEHNRNEKAIENAKEKIKRYESYIHDLKNGNYPSPTVRLERQELIFRIREQEDLINILKGDDENVK